MIISKLSLSKIMNRMPTCVPTNYKVLRVRGNCKEGVFNADLSQGQCDKDWITKLTFALSHLYLPSPNVLTAFMHYLDTYLYLSATFATSGAPAVFPAF
jgi:hypothetical protein